MSKTIKSTKKTTKTSKTNKNGKARIAHHVEPSLLERAQNEPIELVKDMATKSLQFSLGLGAYLLDRPQDIKLGALRGNLRQNLNEIVTKAIDKGQKIEAEQRTWLSNFEREQRKRVKSFLAARRRDLQRTETSIEEKIEEVIAALDIPTRNDIHQLNRRLNDLSKELARQRTSPRKGTKENAKGNSKRAKQPQGEVEATATTA